MTPIIKWRFRQVSGFCAAVAFLEFSSLIVPDCYAATGLSAKDLAAALAAREKGSAYVRLRMEVKQPNGAAKETLQLLIRNSPQRV